ncbi:MAG: phage head-tail connector protein [Pikeienuella sp.]
MRYNRKSHKVTVSNDSLAVSLSDMKDYLRVDGSADDAQITAQITAATVALKEYLRVGLLTETMVFQMDGFSDADPFARIAALGGGVHTASVPFLKGGGNSVDLPYAPIQSVATIETYDTDNTASTFDASKYELDELSGRVYLNEGEVWPSNLRDRVAVVVTYDAGYGSGSIPAPIVEALKMYVAQLYDGSCSGIDENMGRMLALYRRMDDLPYG